MQKVALELMFQRLLLMAMMCPSDLWGARKTELPEPQYLLPGHASDYLTSFHEVLSPLLQDQASFTHKPWRAFYT